VKKLVLEKKETLTLVELALPEPDADHEIVEVELAGIGGSEYLGFRNPGIRVLPNAMAHGIVGTTLDGRRVAVNPLQSCGQCACCSQDLPQLCDNWSMIGVHSDGGFAQQLAVPSSSLVELPASLCWEKAAFIEPFANSVNALDVSDASGDSTVAIIGAGGLGLGLVAACVDVGCREIVISDPSTIRVKAARYLGATSLLKSSSDDTFDLVFDTVGTVSSRACAVAATKRMGTCILLGFGEPQIELDGGALIRAQKRIIGAFAYSMSQFKRAIELAKRCNPEWVESLAFSEVQAQLQKFVADDFSIVKAALRPNR